MSSIIPFAMSIARPDDHGKQYLLTEHLEGVRNKARSFFTTDIDPTVKKLIEFAAISHDIGKANFEWQRYIKGESRRGPNHSHYGAIFFSYLSYHFLKESNVWNERYQMTWLFLTRDIADHHGVLKGYAKNEEIDTGSFEKMDMLGIERWIYSLYPEIESMNISINEEDINLWQDGEYMDILDEVFESIYDDLRQHEKNVDEMMAVLQQWRFFTSIFIAADRFDIQEATDRRIKKSDWNKIGDRINLFCLQGKEHPLASIRSNAQKSIIKQWNAEKNSSYYVLEMPTGYGKTITALKLASEIAKEKGFSKIIYIAPYLSILEQNADVIEKITGFTPLQFHSMAILKNRGRIDNEHLLDENEKTDEMSDIHVQAWANPIICTSLVQWMKAIFPSRAQETLRRIFLQDAIVVIDEPQIIDAAVWNLFLKGTNAMSKLYHQVTIFCSATMPPFHHGLNEEPKRLTVSSKGSLNRYKLKLIEPIDAAECAEKLSRLREPSGAAILNTIHDAIDVYQQLDQQKDTNTFLVHGLMVPIHKSIQIKQIFNALNSQRKKEHSQRILVISTQVIEAGADLSFHYMYRALPILPSLIQAAGRVNRHGEKDMGIIETGKLMRNDQDTRFIYAHHLRRISDDLLFQKDIWLEEETGNLIKQFYQNMFHENNYQSVLQDIKKAMEGNWEALSRHEVFGGNEYHRLPVFIPFKWEEYEPFISEDLKQLMEEFGASSPEDIYSIFKEKKMLNRPYGEKKRFNILFHQFVLNIPAKKALKIVSKEDFLTDRIPILKDDGVYSPEKGLAFMEDEIDHHFI
ncbi:CRISPR-associated helicase Cas3/CRISPR-associated endonuclease Cas3-HD [Bacillus thermophilus]|uniref:CRISPR-associated helicase Cas3/CRISPR-associated endonuclease Cas3-HD n=1 Tax=Siminovitchia thermophila TaxID=1245522 RepID=A0ABS2R794_9BACI|nr:CRISPR-associated helicase/endonuclease Cas3 [Siminovitchia thermophila]MBM7715525.1 CRISPR-associated helicase Cas3/CRISPR-associated endonuclease Cas3-HD [Siminovitchia thermophila]ONK21389.1 hypothetical protein BLX87_21180 [Bacillus sp. VT-16-64]